MNPNTIWFLSSSCTLISILYIIIEKGFKIILKGTASTFHSILYMHSYSFQYVFLYTCVTSWMILPVCLCHYGEILWILLAGIQCHITNQQTWTLVVRPIHYIIYKYYIRNWAKNWSLCCSTMLHSRNWYFFL